MGRIEALEWDSRFFNMRIGRLLLQNDELFDSAYFRQEAMQNFDLVYVFSYEKMLSLSQLYSANLDLVDIMLTMSKPFDKKEYGSHVYDFRNRLSANELNNCYEIAESTSIVSRFFKEQLIGPEKTKSLYREWIDNGLKGDFSDGIFLEKDNGIVTGLHLIRIDHPKREGIFTLTGVDPQFKRLGLGRKLWEQSFGFFANETDIVNVKSTFSLQNTDSFNFHLKMGFNKILETKYIYHFRNIK